MDTCASERCRIPVPVRLHGFAIHPAYHEEMRTHIEHLTDDALITRIHELVRQERRVTAALIAHLAEFDTRRLYRGEGCASLFRYCTEILHFSEHAAYNRIAAARASRRFPEILERLENGTLHLTAVTLLAPILTPGNCSGLLEDAAHKSKSQVLEIVARVRPEPAVPSVVRKVAVRSDAADAPVEESGNLFQETAGCTEASSARPGSSAVPAAAPASLPRPAIVLPLAPAQYRIQFTAGEAMRARLLEAQALLRHRIPDGDPAEILDLALKVLLKEIKKRKVGEVDRPRVAKRAEHSSTAPSRPGSASCHEPRPAEGRAVRYVPMSVRRAVWAGDEGCCAFRARDGRRCGEKGFLEFHHVKPCAAGGPATVENIELRCRSHNDHEAEEFFGRAWREVKGGRARAS